MAKKPRSAGLREAKQRRYYAAGRSKPRANSAPDDPGVPTGARSEHMRLTLGPGGRFVIPKKLRKAMQVVVGDVMTAQVVGGELRVVGWRTGLQRIQEAIAKRIPPGVSLVDKLIEERRREFEMEERKIAEDRRRWARQAKRNG